jgi:hypothetical protein
MQEPDGRLANEPRRRRSTIEPNYQAPGRRKGTREMQGITRRFDSAKTPRRFWFAERVAIVGLNIAAGIVAVLIALPLLYVIFKFWQMVLTS